MIKHYPKALFVLLLFSQRLFASTADTVVIPAPIVATCSPDTGTAGTVVTIRGAYFTGAQRLLFGNVDAYSFNVVTDSLITAVVGSGGSGPVTIETPRGTGSFPEFTFYAGTTGPHITSFSPDTGTTGTVITLHGAYLSNIKGVLFGFVSASSFTVLSDSLVTAVVGTGASGIVLTWGPNGTGSLPGFVFATSATATGPHITSFSPDSAATGTTVTIHGSHFTGVDTVGFGDNGVLSFKIVSDTLITAVVGPDASGSVVVAGPGGSASLGGFVYIPSPPIPMPYLLSFSPDSAAEGATVLLHGYNFTGITEVTFGSPEGSPFTVVSDTLISAIVGPASSGQVQVSGPGGYSNKDGFVLLRVTGLKHLLLYPNPAVGGLQTVSVPGSATVRSQLEVTDMDGRILRVIPVSPNTNQVQINTTGLHKGAYKLVWSDGQHSSNQTILVL